jgi:hypothetical protein
MSHIYNYRKIYENAFGPIPKDKDGRTFDIHHKDGNRKNNSLDNLIALSIQDHYNIHYQQGDFNACRMIAKKMKLNPALISELTALGNQKRLRNGSHNFLNSEAQSALGKRNLKRNPHFFTGEIQKNWQLQRIKSGNHISQKKHICTKCGKEGFGGGMFKHQNRCTGY